MIVLRRALPFLAACLALFLIGCSLLPAPLDPSRTPLPALPGDLAAHRDEWVRGRSPDYTWTFQVGCECGSSGEYTVTVVDGQATEIQHPPRADLAGPPVQTVDDLYAQAATTIADGGEVHATWGDSGIPTTITFDPIPNAIDDELSVSVQSFTPAD